MSDHLLSGMDKARAEAEARLPASLAQLQIAKKYIPNGTLRSRWYWPFPIFAAKGEGAYLYDLDGNKYIDFHLAASSLIIGHRHPAVLSAVRSQLDRGLIFGPPVADEARLAKVIVEHVPNADWVAFVGSGTEATLAALRVARAATGREKIAKFEGGYHGWHDLLNYNVYASGPALVADSVGMSRQAGDQLVVLPFNDSSAIDRIHQLGSELACVVVEGVQGSAPGLPSKPGFVADVRRACQAHGILLINDEVVTGFRLGPSGAAGYYGFEADLTTLGKALGGGLPVGAICGSAALRDVIESPKVYIGSTFTANPMTMVAGNAQLDVLLKDESSYPRLWSLTDRLRTGLTAAFAEFGVPGYVTGLGSIWALHFSSGPPATIRDLASANEPAAMAIAAYIRREGVFISDGRLGFMSTAHTNDDIDEALEAVARALTNMKADGFFDEMPRPGQESQRS